MNQPEFNPAEQYLVDYYRNMPPRQWWTRSMHDAYFLVPALVLFAFGLQNEEPWAMLLGFGLLLFHLVVDAFRSAKWGAVLQSIIRKYDRMINEP